MSNYANEKIEADKVLERIFAIVARQYDQEKKEKYERERLKKEVKDKN